LPYAQFRTLQITQDGDRAMKFFFDLANHFDSLTHAIMGRVAHIDAKDIGASFEQLGQYVFVGRSRTKGGNDLDPSQASHHRISSPWASASRVSLQLSLLARFT
jgi:hypothetical protein